MTFPRALIIALMTAALSRAEEPQAVAAIIILAWLAWAMTTDPLPAAIRHGLHDFAKDYRRGE